MKKLKILKRNKKTNFEPKMGGLLRTKSWVSVPKMEKIKKKSCFSAQNGKIVKKKKEKKFWGLKWKKIKKRRKKS